MARNNLAKLAEDMAGKISRKSPSSIFITGTDTGIGKTYVACALLREFERQGIPAVGFKPISCGKRDDPVAFWRIAKRKVPLDLINPIHLTRREAPLFQRLPSWPLLLKSIRNAFLQLKGLGYQMIVVEGAGGLLCPIQSQYTMRDLAQALNLPLLLVARDRLGALNHSLLTLEAAERSGLGCSWLALNRFGRSTLPPRLNHRALQQLTNVPVYFV